MPKPIIYNANAIIYFSGDKADGLFILKQGKVELTYQDIHTGTKNREPINIGEFFGVQVALAGNLHDETAMAVTDCTVVYFTVQEFEQLVSENPRILIKMLQVFSNKLRHIHRQVQNRISSESIDTNPEAGLFSVGEYYINEGKYAQATCAYKRYLKYWPTGVYAPQAKLRAEEAEAMWEKSLDELSIHDNRTKTVLAGYSSMSLSEIDSQYKLKQYQIAMKGFLSLLQGGKELKHEPYAEFRVGCCLYHLEKYPEAIQQLTSVLRKYPKHDYLGEAVYYIGLSYEADGNGSKAMGFFRKASSLLPKNSPLYRQMIIKIRSTDGGV